ncbi:MAG: hypothetical protein K2N34_04935, partial [Lachnospiraceae bacterium]|nr:hypothetical protein [Lachnospiraceae bacterium]
PKTATSIPIPDIIDFKNVVFIVNNKQKNFSLFELSQELVPIEIDKDIFIKSDYSKINSFEHKKVILVISDKNPWVKERKGYDYPHIRKDILVISNGRALNTTIQSYNNKESEPVFSYRDVTGDSIVISNLTLYRTDKSTHKTFCLTIRNANNITIKNITIFTPDSYLFGDAIFTINNSTNVLMDQIYINGTYSQNDKYGYGISMNNVFNSTFTDLYGIANWGIFGNNNINTVKLKNCDINRFDIHCYGKDVSCTNTFFRNLYNQFSSFYGELIFDKCFFSYFVPVLIDGSYSAYTSFDIKFNQCNIQVNPNRPYLINMMNSKHLIDNIRPELSRMEWPNLYINNVNIDSPSDTTDYFLYHTSHNIIVELDKPIRLQINKLNYNFNDLVLSNSFIKFKRKPILDF